MVTEKFEAHIHYTSGFVAIKVNADCLFLSFSRLWIHFSAIYVFTGIVCCLLYLVRFYVLFSIDVFTI